MKIEILSTFEISDERIALACKEHFSEGDENDEKKKICVQQTMVEIMEDVLKDHVVKGDPKIQLTSVVSMFKNKIGLWDVSRS